MKKQFLIIYIALIIHSTFGLNVDYGASIDSYNGWNISGSSFLFGFEKVSIYSSLQFSENISLAVDGYVKYNYSTSSSEIMNPFFDFNTLLFTIPAGSMQLSIGRQYISDYGSSFIGHNLDGVSVSIPLGSGTLVANAGMSTLLNKKEVTIYSTSLDDININRIVEGADFIKEFDLITFWASFYSYQDFQSLINNLPIYIGGGVTGTIMTDIFYTVKGAFQTGRFFYIDESSSASSGVLSLAGMGSFNATWYMNLDNSIVKSLSPFVSVDFGISSGDSGLVSTSLGEKQSSSSINSFVSLYTPISVESPGVIYSVYNQNLTYLKLQGSVSPFKNLQAQLGSTLFFRTIKGAMSDTDVRYDTDGSYIGTEFSLTGNYRPFSDLGISVTGGIFIPDGVVLTSGVFGLLTAYVSLSI